MLAIIFTRYLKIWNEKLPIVLSLSCEPKKRNKKKHWEIKGRLDDAERKIFVVSITECKYDDEKNTNTINISLISLVRIIESTFFPEGLT